MTHSGILHDMKSGRSYVLVRFERKDSGGGKKKVIIGEKAAPERKTVPEVHEMEIRIPGEEIVINKGFSREEEEEILAYLKEHGKEIREKAAEISSIRHIFGD